MAVEKKSSPLKASTKSNVARVRVTKEGDLTRKTSVTKAAVQKKWLPSNF